MMQRGRWLGFVVGGLFAVGCDARGPSSSVTVDAGNGGDDVQQTGGDDARVTNDRGATECPAPRVICAGQCVDVRSNGANCGGCGIVCTDGASCSSGQCVTGPSCQSPQMMCGSRCVDTRTDTANCGACGRACTSGQSCNNGQCTSSGPTCVSPQIPCGSTCVDPRSDARNCGLCGFICQGNERCTNSQCVPNTVPTDAGMPTGNGPSAPCADETSCALSEAQCVSFNAAGFCTQICTPGTTSSEQAQCGTSGTCVSGIPLRTMDGQAVPGLCMQPCNPSAPNCRTGQICTGFWINNTNGTPDTSPGCWIHCTQDSQCAGSESGNVCNVRTGFCGTTAANPSLRADGAPCNPTTAMTTPQCRGICFRMTDTSTTQGICGSYLNLALRQSCFDDPSQPPITRPGDNLGLCLWRTCTSNSNCDAGHICRYPEQNGAPVTTGGRLCDFPTTAQPS